VEDGGGSFKVLNLPFRMTGADTRPCKTVSALGEHTDELREEIRLAQDGAIPSGKTEAIG
jgi:crotonobetainyl-CoA:carnitine CoA-transferase CaiB-like acyl-CoA transferase